MIKPPRLSKSEIKKKKTEKEIAILRFLRVDARIKKSYIAEQLGISPANMLSLFKKTTKKYITKYSSLIDFENMGYFVGSFFIIKLPKNEKNKIILLKFLSKSKNINTMTTTTTDDVLLHTYFKNMGDFVDFRQFISELAENVKEHEIVSEVTKECFMP